MIKKIITDEYEVTYEDNDKIKQAIFDRLIEYFMKHNSFRGECILQMDDPIIDAPNVMADISDNLIKFKVENR